MKPNLTGTWKLNLEKSKLSDGNPIPYYTEFLREIDHREPHVRTVERIKTPPSIHADRTLATDFITDGKETEVKVNGAPVQVSAKWEGNTLVTSFAREGFTVIRKSTMTADGKSIIAEWLLTQGAESRSATITFLKTGGIHVLDGSLIALQFSFSLFFDPLRHPGFCLEGLRLLDLTPLYRINCSRNVVAFFFLILKDQNQIRFIRNLKYHSVRTSCRPCL